MVHLFLSPAPGSVWYLKSLLIYLLPRMERSRSRIARESVTKHTTIIDIFNKLTITTVVVMMFSRIVNNWFEDPIIDYLTTISADFIINGVTVHWTAPHTHTTIVKWILRASTSPPRATAVQWCCGAVVFLGCSDVTAPAAAVVISIISPGAVLCHW